MKKLFLFILFAFLFLSSRSQVITGTVFDNASKQVIGYASLYFTGTFIGTTTDKDGNFELDVTKNKNMPLTVSAIGYYSTNITDFLSDKPVKIYLEPKIYELGEVTVKSKSLANRRKANLLTFREVFLGSTENARNCYITNENDITFNYNSDNDTLRAFASKPLEIDNRSLGYKILYYLNKFMYDRNNRVFIIRGDMIFKEDLSIGSKNKEAFERRRKNAYLGSRIHFFRTLWQNQLNSSSFIVKNSSDQKLKYDDIVITSGNKKYLRYFEPLKIGYHSKETTGRLVFLSTLVYFDATGYYDQFAVQWEGTMAERRIADGLPYEYSPEP